MSDLWHQMTPDQRQPFLDMATKDRERYEKDSRDYRRRMAEAGVGSLEDVEGEVTTPAASMMMPPRIPSLGGGYLHHASQPQAMNAFDLQRQQQMRRVGGRGNSIEGGHILPTTTMMGRVDLPGSMGGGIMLPSLLPPDMEPEELDHLCHYGGNTTAFQRQQHHQLQQPMNGQGSGRRTTDSINIHGLGLDDQADFEQAMRSLRGQPEATAASIGIDIFGCSAQVQRLGGDSGAKLMDSSVITDDKIALALGRALGAQEHGVGAQGFPKGTAVRRISGQDPHLSSSAGSPSDIHISQVALNGLGGGLEAGMTHRDMGSDGGAAVVAGFFRSMSSSGGGGYPALYPGSPFDCAMNLVEEPAAVHQTLA